ncbi:HK97 family phage prohead protease [Demequina sp.]|uniref:HK97 family phage prohead protease n=1 Tax=Demequina sp. TaxID=2050685 RepID=UPI0025C3812F|nr:HK97 family phage prohead protease [Demequina sp.]
MTTLLQARRATAATERAAKTRMLADRPSHRRCAEGLASGARVAARVSEFRVSEPSTSGIVRFDGYASVTEKPYEMWDWYGPYDEVVRAGAFRQTLLQSDLDVPFVIVHDQIRRIARTIMGTLHLEETEHGLHVGADLDTRDSDVAYIVPKLIPNETGHSLVDEMSFSFRIIKGLWSPDYMQYDIEQVDLHRGDVAIVGYGANPYTAGSGLADDPPEPPTQLAAAAPSKRGVDLISEDDIAPRRFH